MIIRDGKCCAENPSRSSRWFCGNCSIWYGEGQFQRHFGSDQSVWRDGYWSGFVRSAVAGVVLRLRLRSGETPLLRLDAERLGFPVLKR